MPQIKIHNVIDPKSADPLRDALHGQTYMRLEVLVCPVGGSWDVLVQTRDAEVTEADLTEMVLGVMSHALIWARQRAPGSQIGLFTEARG